MGERNDLVYSCLITFGGRNTTFQKATYISMSSLPLWAQARQRPSAFHFNVRDLPAVALCITALPVLLAPKGAYDSLRGRTPSNSSRRPAASDYPGCHKVQITPFLPLEATKRESAVQKRPCLHLDGRSCRASEVDWAPTARNWAHPGRRDDFHGSKR